MKYYALTEITVNYYIQYLNIRIFIVLYQLNFKMTTARDTSLK